MLRHRSHAVGLLSRGCNREQEWVATLCYSLMGCHVVQTTGYEQLRLKMFEFPEQLVKGALVRFRRCFYVLHFLNLFWD